jgi:hypothetical protein
VFSDPRRRPSRPAANDRAQQIEIYIHTVRRSLGHVHDHLQFVPHGKLLVGVEQDAAAADIDGAALMRGGASRVSHSKFYETLDVKADWTVDHWAIR